MALTNAGLNREAFESFAHFAKGDGGAALPGLEQARRSMWAAMPWVNENRPEGFAARFLVFMSSVALVV